MLSTAHRLRHDKDIKTLFASGKSVFDAYAGVKYRKNAVGVTRVAIVVGGKVSKSAVHRNRVRRQYRAILSKHLPMLKPGYDLMLLVRAEALRKQSGILEERLVRVLKRTPLWPAA